MRGRINNARVLIAPIAALMLGPLTAGQAAIAASHDELQTVAPDSVGIDSAAVAKLAQDIRAGQYSNIHSLLVVRSGKLAIEEYFQGEDERRGQALGSVRFDAATLHDLRSVSKSVTGGSIRNSGRRRCHTRPRRAGAQLLPGVQGSAHSRTLAHPPA
jgi:CubicO group peptidase (beta-lactamase class C family)